MNREKIISNVSNFLEENKNDIINQVSNIAYLFENMCYEENTEKEFRDRVEELKYNTYTGKPFLESVASWSRRCWYEHQELYWRMEVMIEGESDEYVRFIYWLYYESIHFSLENNFFGDLTEHISCVFPGEAKTEVAKAMSDTVRVQQMKREKRLEIDLMKLHYEHNDDRIDIVEKKLSDTLLSDFSNLFKRVRISDLMTFMLICSTECKERIYKSLDDDKIGEIEKFQGESLHLRRDTIAECLDNLIHCVE